MFSEVNSAGLTYVNKLTITVGSGKPVIAGSSKVACSPGSLATLNGTWLSLAEQELSDPIGVSQELGGTRVHVNAELAPVLYASRTRVDFQCPNTAAGEGLEIALETAAGTTPAIHTFMLEARPVLLLAEGSPGTQGQITLSSAHRLVTQGRATRLCRLWRRRRADRGGTPAAVLRHPAG